MKQLLTGCLLSCVVVTIAQSQTFGTDFAADYSVVDLGPVPGVGTP